MQQAIAGQTSVSVLFAERNGYSLSRLRKCRGYENADSL